jgi:hypothetical protein
MQQFDLTELLKEIKTRVDEKRAEGLYPPGLEQQLEREFAEIIASTNRRYFATKDLQLHITHLQNLYEQLSGRVSTQSRIPGASMLHWLFGKISKRQVLGLTAQVRDVEGQVIVVLKMLGEFAHSQEEADNRVVRELSQHVLDRVSVVDHLSILTIELESRIRKIESRLGD